MRKNIFLRKFLPLSLALILMTGLLSSTYAATGATQDTYAASGRMAVPPSSTALPEASAFLDSADELPAATLVAQPGPVMVYTPKGTRTISVEGRSQAYVIALEGLNAIQKQLTPLYYLEPRLRTLDDYNGMYGGGFIRVSAVWEAKPIWDYLSEDTQAAIAELSAYQGFLVIKDSPEYAKDADLREEVDHLSKHLETYPRGFMTESLRYFCSEVVLGEMNPDQLSLYGHIVIENPQYQAVKQALQDFYDYCASCPEESDESGEYLIEIYDEMRLALAPFLADRVSSPWPALAELPQG